MIPAAINKSRKDDEHEYNQGIFCLSMKHGQVWDFVKEQKNFFEIIAIFTLAFRDRTIRVSTAKVRIYYAPKLDIGGGAIDKPSVSRVSQSLHTLHLHLSGTAFTAAAN